MNSATTMQSTSTSRPGRKPKKSAGDTMEPGQKPKKVNSEIRKQQNRIASRNYREKRKRKLQYLQQLLREESSGQQSPQQTHTMLDTRPRSVSAEYSSPGHPLGQMPLPPSSEFNALSSTTRNAIDPILATTAAYESHFIATSQPFQSHEHPWHTPIYEPPPPVHMSTWNVPHWMPSVDFSSQVVPSQHEGSYYSPPPTHQAFESVTPPPRQHPEPVPNADLFILGTFGHCGGSVEQSQGISSVSPQPPSKYNQAQYSWVP